MNEPGLQTPLSTATDMAGAGAATVALPTWTVLVLAAFAALIFAIGYDQGHLLQPVFGKAAATAGNHLHELFHDGRHLLGFPCH